MQPWKQLPEHFDILNILSLETYRNKLCFVKFSLKAFSYALNILFSYHISTGKSVWQYLCAYLSIKLQWRQKWKTDASEVLAHSKCLPHMKKKHFSSWATFFWHQMKIQRYCNQCCTLLKQIWVILAFWPPDLLPFTSLIQLKITERKIWINMPRISIKITSRQRKKYLTL